MSRPRLASLFSHLALALAGLCLTCAEVDFLLETVLALLVYLALLALSWRSAGRWALSARAANALGAAIALLAAGWIMLRLNSPELLSWLQDVPITVAIVPYLGPVLMALTLVRLFRPRAPGDFWVLQGLGLVQVALGCVLANGTVFAVLVLAYFAVAVCALAAQESQRQSARSAPTAQAAPAGRRSWLGFSLGWMVALSALALPLFLLTPRVEHPEDWDPFSRFFARNRGPVSQTGFSDEINVGRVGRVENDDSVAFTVSVTDGAGRPRRDLRPDQRWRGIVLDRYEDGVWRSDLAYSSGRHITRPPRQPEPDPDALLLEFRVPGSLGGLFLAEPVPLGENPGALAVWPKHNDEGLRRPQGLFYEADGAFVPVSGLLRKEYRYVQSLSRQANPDRYLARRLRDNYQQRLLRGRVPGLGEWTRDLLLRLTAQQRQAWGELRQALQARTLGGEALPPMYWEDVVVLLTSYLARSGEYGYSLTARRVAEDLDPTLDFLVNVREGRCEQYASALALMLRSLRIPARVVKGYRGCDSGGDGTYQVRQSQAHAWVEVLLPSWAPDTKGKEQTYDWATFDPTPEGDSAGLALSPLTRLWQLQQTGQALWQSLIVGYGAREQADLWDSLSSWERWQGRLPWLAGAVAVGGVLLVARRRRRRSRPVGVGSLYERLKEVLSRKLHVTARSDETPRELAARAAEALGRRAGVAASLVGVPGRVVELFYRARYGGETLPPAQLAEAAAELESLEGALGR